MLSFNFPLAANTTYLVPRPSFVLFWLITSAPEIAAAIASYRRCRCLSRYPIWRSLATALLAFSFTFVWLIHWFVNRKRIAAEWRAYRAYYRPAPVKVA